MEIPLDNLWCLPEARGLRRNGSEWSGWAGVKISKRFDGDYSDYHGAGESLQFYKFGQIWKTLGCGHTLSFFVTGWSRCGLRLLFAARHFKHQHCWSVGWIWESNCVQDLESSHYRRLQTFWFLQDVELAWFVLIFLMRTSELFLSIS